MFARICIMGYLLGLIDMQRFALCSLWMSIKQVVEIKIGHYDISIS